jgi:two-component system sensor histidine kinase BaeS
MDSAPGVPEAEIGRLFDRLYRVESSRSRATGGAGLGLAICRNIVEAHEGTITAKPSPLGGVWITVVLPVTEGSL